MKLNTGDMTIAEGKKLYQDMVRKSVVLKPYKKKPEGNK